MLFNSISYAIFLPIVFIFYWLLKPKYRWVLLLIASYYFYMCWSPQLIYLIILTTVTHYFAALLIEKRKQNNQKKGQKLILVLSICVSLSVLFFYKYFNFFSESFFNVWNKIAIPTDPIILNLILPMGISFYTFQTLSYTVDVYRGEMKAEKHLGYLALYISFFPQLVAGPIERAERLLPQLRREHKFNYSMAADGMRQMAVGFLKKIVIADTVAKGVNIVYNNVGAYSGGTLIIASFLFAIQIYCDFSGYSDIAIGSAKILGIDLMTNFNSPYFSRSIKEFWSRWHISLSTWFRDYVYIPLGGNRVSKLKQNINVIITFLLSGLWHGANWTFVIWGALHGTAQMAENSIRKKYIKFGNKKGLKALPSIIGTFIFVCFAWVFFRANTLNDALYVINHMFDGISNPLVYLKNSIADLNITKIGLLILVFEIALLFIIDYLQLNYKITSSLSKAKAHVVWGVYILIMMIIVIFSVKGTASEFIYFQF